MIFTTRQVFHFQPTWKLNKAFLGVLKVNIEKIAAPVPEQQQ